MLRRLLLATFCCASAPVFAAGDSRVKITLNNTKTATVENRLSENISGKGDALIQAISRNSKALVSKIMKGRMTLNWGPHLLEVEKAGFVSYSEDISVPNKQVLAKNIALVPSNDFIHAYESRARKMRLGAWITSGVAAAGVATAIGFNAWSSRTETAFSNAKATYLQTNKQADYDHMKSLSDSGNNQVLLARVGLGVTVVGLAAATYFWVAGDDPRKYEEYKEAPAEAAGAKVAFGAAPVEGGAALAFAGRR